MIFSHGRIVVDVVIKIERTRYTRRGRPELTPENIFSSVIYREAVGNQTIQGVPDYEFGSANLCNSI
jgi:hypothetical protein